MITADMDHAASLLTCMDIIDILWNVSQDQSIGELTAAQRRIMERDGTFIRKLQEENRELRLHLSLLIRILIERGVFSADDFSTLLAETKTRLVETKAKVTLTTRQAGSTATDREKDFATPETQAASR